MKYLHISIAVLLLTGSTFADDGDKPADQAPSDAVSKEGMATAIPGTAKIDAEIDESWEKAKALDVDNSIVALQAIPAEEMATATVKLMYDEEHLYALWTVKDKKLSAASGDDWGQDSVEVFLDRDKKATPYYESDDAQYRVNFLGSISGHGTGYDESDIQAAAKIIKGGYLVEMAIHVDPKYLESGKKMGLELQVNDDPGTGERSAIAKWHHTEDDSWETTSVFGTLELQ